MITARLYSDAPHQWWLTLPDGTREQVDATDVFGRADELLRTSGHRRDGAWIRTGICEYIADARKATERRVQTACLTISTAIIGVGVILLTSSQDATAMTGVVTIVAGAITALSAMVGLIRGRR